MASTYITKTFSGAATSQKIGTLSLWFKRGGTGASAEHDIIAGPNGGNGGGNRAFIRIDSNNKIDFRLNNSSNTNITNRAFIDFNAWYHLVLAVDLTQASGADRMKLYINGVEETSFSSQNYPGTSLDLVWGQQNVQTDFGYDTTDGGGGHFEGQMSHIHWVDGQQLTPSSFGETDATTGEWKIKASPNISYGNNGFFILKDGNSVTDQSGNGHNFTVSGGTLTKTEDCPSNVFCCLNGLDTGWTGGNLNLANGNNNTMNTSGAGDYGLRGTLAAKKGKYYMEFRTNNSGDGANTLGIAPTDLRLVQNITSGSPTAGVYAIQRYNDSSTNIYTNGTFTSQNTTMFGGYTNNSDIISFAVDLDNSKIFVGKNGVFKDTSGNTGDPAAGTNPTFTGLDSTKFYTFYTELRLNQDNGTQCNFGNGYFGTTAVSSAGTNASGNGIFEYDVPAGFTALSTKGINSF